MRLVWLLAGVTVLAGCRAYTDSTPRRYLEGDDAADYRRVFREEVPKDVTVVHAVVVAYQWRPGVVTTDDFEFELVVPAAWLAKWKKALYLAQGAFPDVAARKNQPIRDWYAPKALGEYEAYRDLTSVGYVHMLVDRTVEPDGRYRVFFSKH